MWEPLACFVSRPEIAILPGLRGWPDPWEELALFSNPRCVNIPPDTHGFLGGLVSCEDKNIAGSAEAVVGALRLPPSSTSSSRTRLNPPTFTQQPAWMWLCSWQTPAGEALKLTLAIYDVVSDTHGADMTVGWATARRQRVAAPHSGPVRSLRGHSRQQRPQASSLASLKLRLKQTFRGFTCRRALVAQYFSCKEWCWIRSPGRCRCYSLHLGKGLGWDRAFGSRKCGTDSLSSLWPGERKRKEEERC